MLNRTLFINRPMQETADALELVKTAGAFKSTIKLTCGRQSANAKSTLSVLALNMQRGSRISLEIDGPDCEQAMQTLTAFFIE